MHTDTKETVDTGNDPQSTVWRFENEVSAHTHLMPQQEQLQQNC